MGSDNAKSSHRTRRIKERPSPHRSVDARSVGSRSVEESRQGRSNRSIGSAHDHGSVASSQSSALVVDTGTYKEMSNRHRRGRTSDPKSIGSCGCMKQGIFVLAFLFAWVLFYLGKTFPEQIADAIGSIMSMNTAEDKISASTSYEQVESEGGKSGDAEVNNVKDNDPDTDLAALASGAGTNLWENAIQTTDVNDESASSTDVATGDSSSSSLSTGVSTDDRSTNASGEKTEKTTTRDVSSSKARSSSDATKDSSTSSNDPAMSDGEHSGGVDTGPKSEDTTSDSDLTLGRNSLGDARSIDNDKQIDSPQMSDVQSSDPNVLDGETELQVLSQGQENELQQSSGSAIGDSRDFRGSQGGTHDDASDRQQMGDEGASDFDQGLLEQSDGARSTGGKQGMLRGSNTSRSIGGGQEVQGSNDTSSNISMQDDASNEQQEGDEGVDQDLLHESSGATRSVEKHNKVRVSNTLQTNTQPLAEEDLSTSLRGSAVMQMPDDQGQVMAMNHQTSQGDTLVDDGDILQLRDVDTNEESTSLGDTTTTQESLLQYQDGGMLPGDMSIRNVDGNDMILEDSGLQTMRGSMEDEPQQGGVTMHSHATRPDIGGETVAFQGQTHQHQQLNMMSNEELEPDSGNSMILHTRGVQTDDGSISHQHQQDGGEISSEVFEQNGSGDGSTYERNGAQDADGVIVEQNLHRQGDGETLQGSGVDMEDESMTQQLGASRGSGHVSMRNGVVSGMVGEDHDLQTADGVMPNLHRQGDGETLQGTGVDMEDESMAQQLDASGGSGHVSMRNGGVPGMVGEDNDLRTADGVMPNLHRQADGETLQGSGVDMEDESMAQQLGASGGSGHVSIGNGVVSGMVGEDNDLQTADGVMPNLHRQGDGETLQGSGVDMEDESMAQQLGASGGSGHVSMRNGGVSGMVGEDYDLQTADGVTPNDMISLRSVDGAQGQDVALKTEGDFVMQQQGVGISDEMLGQNGHAAMLDENDALPMRDGSVTPNQVQDGDVMPNESFVQMVDSNGLVRQNSDMQFNHDATARRWELDGAMPPGDMTYNGGYGHRQRENSGMMDNSLSEQNDGAGLTMRQQKSGSTTFQHDLRTTSRDPSSQDGGSGMRKNDMDGGFKMQEQMIQQDQGMLTNDLTLQDSDAGESLDLVNNSRSNRLNDAGDSGGEDARLRTPSRHQSGTDGRQSVIFNKRTLGEDDSRASGGLVGTENHGTLRRDSQGDILEKTSAFGGGSISRGNADEIAGNSMVNGMSNILQPQSTGSRNLPSQQIDRHQFPVTERQGNRRLQEMSEPQSPYENMGATELAQYVNNHALYRNLVNFDEDLPFDPSSQVPYLFHIHKSGGSSMKHMLTCMGLTQTRRGSSEGCDDQDDLIHVCPLVWGTVVNADASSPNGIARIKKLGIFDINVPKLVITTSRFYEALSIFTPQHRGRLFLILRDPVERAISKYYYNQVATWEKNYNPSIANMTLIEFAQSRACYDNWITRRLIHKMNPNATVTMGDLRLAKEVLRQKALILLLSDFEQSSYRMVQYFDLGMTANQHWCGHRYSKVEVVNNNPHPMPTKDSPEWAAIRDRNLIDVELYRYALELYHNNQGQFLYEKFGPLTLPEAVDPTRKQ